MLRVRTEQQYAVKFYIIQVEVVRQPRCMSGGHLLLTSLTYMYLDYWVGGKDVRCVNWMSMWSPVYSRQSVGLLLVYTRTYIR